MIQHLISFLDSYSPLSREEKEYLEAHIPIQSFSKNEFLLKQDEISNRFFFIINGCARMFYTVDGMEKTAFFYMEKDFVSAYERFTKQVPSKHSIQTIEKSTVAIISVETAQNLLQRFPKFEYLARVMMENELIIYQNIISSFITQNAEQRYLHLLKHRPDIIQRIPQYHLATYVGVSPETLSRIRKRILMA
ncbi:MAG: Crp/Fnr family transcriptional regulator [Saprospiraceae bacterium]|nr:Crp/Fnr family transcriptional regulator [Saprospiraceae bacterium]